MLIEMTIKGLTVDPVTNMPIVILHDDQDRRILPIWVGVFEANAIALQIENVHTPRPMTHDLLRTVLDDLGVSLERITVTDLREGVFYAELELNARDGVHTISSRPSDAIALAARTGSPIYAAESVLDEAAYVEEAAEEGPEQEEVVEQFKEFINSVDPEDFAL